MNRDASMGARRLLIAIGEIADSLLDEAELADIATVRRARKRVVQYGALGVGLAASLGIAAAYWLRRPKRAADAMASALQEIA